MLRAHDLSPILEKRLAKIRDAAPPHPKDALYRYLRKVYRLRRTCGDCRDDLEELAEQNNIVCGDKLLRVLIYSTASEHVTPKMISKYALALERALDERVKSKNLRSVIENAGGISKYAKSRED